MAMRTVDIEINQIGKGKILIDGQDISGMVRGVAFSAEVDKLTTVTVTLIPEVVRIRGLAHLAGVLFAESPLAQDSDD